jgi:ketosteroid isomerase-like protein
MGSANVQVLRRVEELFNARDLDEYVLLLDPAIEWHVAPEDPDTTVHRGREEVRAYLEGWIDAFADLRIHMESARETDDDRVRTVIRFTGHGTGSGVTLDERIGFVWTFRDGRVTKVEDQGRDQASTK